MKESEARNLYMKAHVRMSAKMCPDNWTDAEIMFSFATLRPPAVPFEDWCGIFGIKFDDERMEANAAAVESFAGNPIVKVEPVKSD